MTNVHILCELKDLTHGCVMKRPSATCKTPYVADISLQNDSSEAFILGHTPKSIWFCSQLCALFKNEHDTFQFVSDNWRARTKNWPL